MQSKVAENPTAGRHFKRFLVASNRPRGWRATTQNGPRSRCHRRPHRRSAAALSDEDLAASRTPRCEGGRLIASPAARAARSRHGSPECVASPARGSVRDVYSGDTLSPAEAFLFVLPQDLARRTSSLGSSAAGRRANSTGQRQRCATLTSASAADSTRSGSDASITMKTPSFCATPSRP
jgi:hypothetical protein